MPGDGAPRGGGPASQKGAGGELGVGDVQFGVCKVLGGCGDSDLRTPPRAPSCAEGTAGQHSAPGHVGRRGSSEGDGGPRPGAPLCHGVLEGQPGRSEGGHRGRKEQSAGPALVPTGPRACFVTLWGSEAEPGLSLLAPGAQAPGDGGLSSAFRDNRQGSGLSLGRQTPSHVGAADSVSRGALAQLWEPGSWPVAGSVRVHTSPGPRGGPHWGPFGHRAGAPMKGGRGPWPLRPGCQACTVYFASPRQTASIWPRVLSCFRLAFLLDLRLKYFSWWQKWLSALSPSQDGRNVQEESGVLARFLKSGHSLTCGLERQGRRSALLAPGDGEALGWESGCLVSRRPPARGCVAPGQWP